MRSGLSSDFLFIILRVIMSHLCITLDLGTRIHALQENFDPMILKVQCDCHHIYAN